MVSVIGICLVIALWVSFLMHERKRAALELLEQYVAIARDYGFKLESVGPNPEGRPERRLRLTEGKSLYLTLTLSAWTGKISASFMGHEPTLHQTMHFRRQQLRESVNVWLLEDVVGEWRTWRDLISEWQDFKARHLAPPSRCDG